MPSISGSFSGRITTQSGLPLSDQPNHELGLAEVTGTQSSEDPLWNDAKITYWGITDLLDGRGSQTGYYNNIHADGDQERGTFEGKVTATDGQMVVEGTWQITGGNGKYQGASGSGSFRTVAKSQTEVEATWTGSYELAKAQSA